MYIKRFFIMDENVVRKFINLLMVDELGRIVLLDNKMRVLVKGEVFNVSCCDILRDKNLIYCGSD